MADTKTSALAAITSPVLSTDVIPVLDDPGGTPVLKKATLAQIMALLGDTIRNQSVADQTINPATTAMLVGSDLAVPADKLRIGTTFTWRVCVSKTGSGTAANTFLVKLGTNDGVTDPTILTFTTLVGTGIIDVGWVDITVTIRGPLSASAIAQGMFFMTHNLQTTGLINLQVNVQKVTSGVFNATTAGLFMSLACTTGASTTLTFSQVVSNAGNL